MSTKFDMETAKRLRTIDASTLAEHCAAEFGFDRDDVVIEYVVDEAAFWDRIATAAAARGEAIRSAATV